MDLSGLRHWTETRCWLQNRQTFRRL